MKQNAVIAVLAVFLIGGTALFLNAVKGREKLGTPGVKVVQGPIEFPDNKIVTTNIVGLPVNVTGYESVGTPLTKAEIDTLPSDTTFGRRTYKASDGFECFVSVVLMGTDRTSIHPPEYCLVGQGWNIDESAEATVPMRHPEAYELPVMKLTASKELQTASGKKVKARGVYLYWFVADQQLTRYHSQRMLQMATKRLQTGVLDRWAYVTYFSACLPGQEERTFNRMKEFIAVSLPEFQLTTGKPRASETASLGSAKP